MFYIAFKIKGVVKLESIIETKFDSQGNNWSIALNGEIDLFNSNEIKAKLLDLLKERPTDLIIDCKELEYIDSTALGAFVAVLKNAKNCGCEMILKDVRPNIKKLFKITNLDKAFKLEVGANEQ